MNKALPLALSISLAPLACAGAEPVTIGPATPAAEVTVAPPPAEKKPEEKRPEPPREEAAAPAPAVEEAPKVDEPKVDVPKAAVPKVVGAKKPKAPPGQSDQAELGMIGLLNSGDQGGVWGAATGDSFGVGGLGLAGAGIGLGSIGTLGHGAGTGFGQVDIRRRGKPPQIVTGAMSVNGRLPPEVIKRIVRTNYGRFRLCYENGLRNNPALAGRILVKFVIGRDGSINNVANGGSDVPDAGVVGCVVRAFYGLTFPQPEGGIVSVQYPLSFSPGDRASTAPPPLPPLPPPPPAEKGRAEETGRK